MHAMRTRVGSLFVAFDHALPFSIGRKVGEALFPTLYQRVGRGWAELYKALETLAVAITIEYSCLVFQQGCS
jgi:hypothetical protein